MMSEADCMDEGVERTARELEELGLLFDIARTLDKHVELRSALGPLLSLLETRSGLARGMVTLLDRSTGLLKIEEAYGLSSEEKERGRYRLGEGLVGRVFESGSHITVPDLSQEPRFLNRAGGRSRDDLIGVAYYCVPIRSGGAVMGTLSAERRLAPGAQELRLERDRALLERVAGIIADSAKLRERILEEQFHLRGAKEGLSRDAEPVPPGFVAPRIVPESAIVGTSAAMRAVYDMVSQVAPSDATVLVTGESGTGKELVASELHRLSRRSAAPLVKINCAALPESIIESELFGHEKGAFTGAVGRKRGRFELAHEGTLFMDEIGEIDQNVQIKILRVLQEKKFERVGGEDTLEVDVRIVAATNRDLKAEIEKGNFREDLYYRLNVVNIHVPPLRERKDDIPLLATAFLKEFAEENGKPIEGLDGRARAALYAYDWPGNVRELRNCMESAVVMAKGSVLGVDDLPPTIRASSDTSWIRIPLGTPLAEAEKIIIRDTLSANRGNKSRTAEVLDIGRKTLHRKLAEWGDETPSESETGEAPEAAAD